MRVLYEEGLTSHLGPESCVCSGNDAGEALTGGTASRAIEPRKAFSKSECLRCRLVRGATPGRPSKVRASRTLRGRRPRARVQTFYAGTERSWDRPGGDGCPVRGVNSEEALRR